MCFLLQLLSVAAVVSCYEAASPKCCINEIPNPNPKNCVNDCCPTACGQTSACPTKCSSKPCICSLMYHRAQNNTCIPSRECPPIPCPQNEKYDPCPVCSESCSNASPTGKRCRFIGHIGITVICEPKCRCIDFYWRNSNNNCVTYSECPKQKPIIIHPTPILPVSY